MSASVVAAAPVATPYFILAHGPTKTVHLRRECYKLARAPEVMTLATLPRDVTVCGACEQHRIFTDAMSLWRGTTRTTTP